ncbi:hypothetical protein SAMN05421805_102315 [Saccharopolyspora antimicrobica]|uniref:Uncharacterized protein n=1 Tax=Saccharopolyspora antimicrobica TaxID=455193 RepID=A0A1I4VQF7_9PSEU|nr:hypothetical protein ATL45_5672 [Saccharopolyspora antimicrobica]SFN03249.1 hypothetical protein SAMN05421805_102315 [Saccharopolyspora antimicrobica]
MAAPRSQDVPRREVGGGRCRSDADAPEAAAPGPLAAQRRIPRRTGSARRGARSGARRPSGADPAQGRLESGERQSGMAGLPDLAGGSGRGTGRSRTGGAGHHRPGGPALRSRPRVRLVRRRAGDTEHPAVHQRCAGGEDAPDRAGQALARSGRFAGARVVHRSRGGQGEPRVARRGGGDPHHGAGTRSHRHGPTGLRPRTRRRTAARRRQESAGTRCRSRTGSALRTGSLHTGTSDPVPGRAPARRARAGSGRSRSHGPRRIRESTDRPQVRRSETPGPGSRARSRAGPGDRQEPGARPRSPADRGEDGQGRRPRGRGRAGLGHRGQLRSDRLVPLGSADVPGRCRRCRSFPRPPRLRAHSEPG